MKQIRAGILCIGRKVIEIEAAVETLKRWVERPWPGIFARNLVELIHMKFAHKKLSRTFKLE
jgi:ribose 5-phosphate isomerase RpiB